MKLRRLFSFKHWSVMFTNVRRYVMSSQVSLIDKLLFLVPIIVYWIFPFDLLPGLPIDDIGITMLLMGWFTTRVERKYPTL
ncbi:hypothetical protein [Paenibacillus macquariensis]|uniref:DUF1232 domain-containing protein n=1 Tax=Paenibacillus macquariensis TaxID=948756 RepID=A0ABY1JY93_9BACL|nr:hypothetical protein [Paenibacillus macquariensis]MEC0089172.1 hypothetical protein [Paenibacillus macquariensis]OAB33408.1 hypothetical protein PMSM_15520 [Paenibacillus macquariensis subsp. macquariensis]SIQ97204.1 hypothetical protein SAMN05421578_105287 [Paenibacillus macquariensis]